MRKIIFIVILLIVFTGIRFHYSHGIYKPQPKDSLCYYYYMLGLEQGKSGDYKTAKKNIAKSIALNQKADKKDSLLYAGSVLNLGIIAKNEGAYSISMDYFNIAENIFKQKLEENNSKFAKLYNNKAIIYKYKLDYHNAELYYHRALDIYKYNNNNNGIAKILNNLGSLYRRKNEFKKAVIYFKKSLEIKTELNYSGESSCYSGLAISYEELNDFNNAEKYYLKAIETTEEEYGKKSPNIALVFMYYGKLCFKNGQKKKALNHYQKAYKIFTKIYGKNHQNISYTLKCIGDYYFQENNTEKALSYYQRAIISVCNTFNDNSIYSNPVFEDSFDSVELLEVLSQKTLALYSLYHQNNTKQKEKLIACNNTAILATEIIRKTSNSFHNNESKLNIMKLKKDIFFYAAKTSFELYNITKDTKFKQLAYSYCEQNKSSVLLSEIKNNEAMEFGDVPKELREKERLFSQQTKHYQSLLYDEQQKEKPDKTEIKEYNDKLFELTKSNDSLIDTFEKNYTKYYNLKYSDKEINIKKIQADLKDNEIIIEYMLPSNEDNQIKDSALVFVISKNKFEARSFATDSVFRKSYEIINKYLSPDIFDFDAQTAFNEYTQAAYNLYKILLKPFENIISGKRLIIIPDRQLSYIPFGALITELPSDNTPDYRKLNYVIKKYPISYSYSISLRFHEYYRNKKPLKGLLSFAPSYKNLNENNLNEENKMFLREYKEILTELKGTQTEINEIYDIFGGTKFSNIEATENKFKETAAEYDVLHLAMHAVLNNDNPMYSKLVFTQTQDNTDDGFLNTYEIYNMKINSKLVVLSACNTGRGEYNSGEGVISLARGFKYAGVPSLVMTLWSVEDNSSSGLMANFYKQLSDNTEKDISMQKAKINYINSSDPYKAHPYFWAAYVNIGDTEAVNFKNKNRRLLYILLTFVSVLMFLPELIRINHK